MKIKHVLQQIVPLLAAAAIAAGCASSGGKGQATSDTIQKTADAVGKINLALDTVVKSLTDLTGNPQPDLRPQFKSYKTAVSDLDSIATKVRNAATAMDGKTEQLMTEWDKQLALINNEDIKSRSLERKNEITEQLTQIKESFASSKQTFNPVMSDLKDIVTYLETDLTPGGVAAIKNTAAKAIAGVPELRQSMDEISRNFKELGLSLSSVQPVPEPAPGEPKK